MASETKNCQNCKEEFSIEPEDFLFYERIKVPPPTFCPECRMIRRFAHRNERNLFRVKDALTGKEIFSGIPPQAPVKVYDHDYWWSDAWDPMEYGRDCDFSRPFLEQFRELMLSVPFPSRNITNLVNSDYSDHAGDLKNCYLCFNVGMGENSAYLVNGVKVKDSYDLNDAADTELSYDSLSLGECYQVFFSMQCRSSTNLWFCRDCTGCSNCFGCINLRNKHYYIFNKPYSKEEYFEEIKKFNLNFYSRLAATKKQAESFWLRFPQKFMHGYHNNNVSGDYINFSRNVKFSYGIDEGENLKYCQEVYRQKGNWPGGKDSYDYYNWGYGSELMYEVYGSGRGCRNVHFCVDCWPACQDIEYCVRCVSSSSLFGCVGLKKKSYCILNKQYSEKEYFSLRDKIIKHMQTMPYVDKKGRVYRYGEFFPIEFSLFAYNETAANDYFPLTKKEAESQGYLWREIERREYQTTLAAENLPDKIEQVEDSVLGELISCLSCKRAYHITAAELEFLRKKLIPLPRFCPDCRYLRRFSLRNLPRYYQRNCACGGQKSENGIYQNQASHFHLNERCPNEFETSYAPERPEIVYCEQCYQAEVV